MGQCNFCKFSLEDKLKESKPLDDQNIINIEKQESPIKEDK